MIMSEFAKLFLMGENKIYPFIIGGQECYLAKTIDTYGIAIPYNGEKKIYDTFVGMELLSSFVIFDKKEIPVLALRAPKTVSIDNFSLIAEDFISPNNRSFILNDPYDWVEKWKEIFGNSIKNKMVYDIIGELFVLRETYKKDKTVVWVGRKGGTHDIVAEKEIFEVKTTIRKTENVVEINSSYQLSTEKTTHLAFVRVEEKPHSELSINSLVEDLSNLGYDKNEIEKYLDNEGYKIGSRYRNITYDLLSYYLYDITKKSFPVIGLDKINTLAPLENIIGYRLTIDLLPIEKTVVFEKE